MARNGQESSKDNEQPRKMKMQDLKNSPGLRVVENTPGLGVY